MIVFFTNNTAAGNSAAYPVVAQRGALLALNIEGLGAATCQLQRKTPNGTFIPVIFGTLADITLDGHYIIDGLSGTYRIAQTGTADGLYASLETENAALASAQ